MNILGFQLTNLLISLDEIVWDMGANGQIVDDYHYHRRLISIGVQALEDGYEEFDWKRLSKEGKLSINDYKLFAKYLKNCSPEDYKNEKAKSRS